MSRSPARLRTRQTRTAQSRIHPPAAMRRLRKPYTEDIAAHLPQPRRFHLQPDDEQEQHHAELGEVQQFVRVFGEAERQRRADNHPDGKIAED
jgi:hypothetical protein